MAITSDILIAHAGKHHALHLVVGCIHSGAKTVYLTPFYRCGIGAFLANMPGKFATKAKGYYHPDISAKVVISSTQWQIKKLIALIKNDYSIEVEFDKYVAREIEKGKYQAKILVTLQDYMPETVKAAKKRGWKIWSDQILNQSTDMMVRITKHEKILGFKQLWLHSEVANDYILSVSDVVTIPSNYCLDGIRARLSSKVKVEMIPYGADSSQFAEKHSHISDVITILARAHSVRKGGHLFLLALKQSASELLALSPRQRIDVIILGSLEPELVQLLSEIKLDQNITVVQANVPHGEVSALYQQASIFVMPSLSESMSLACVEALHTGMPLIITKYCGIDGFESGQMGVLVEDTVESVANGLVFAFKNRVLWESWGRNSRLLANQYTWQAYENKISKLVHNIL